MINPFKHHAAEQMGTDDDAIIETECLTFVTDPEEYESRLTSLLARGRLVLQTEADKKIIRESTWKRAGGGAICPACKQEFDRHPHVHQYAILTKLCDGRLVKL